MSENNLIDLVLLGMGRLCAGTFMRLDFYAQAGLPQKLQNQIPGLSRTFLGHFPGLFQDRLSFFCCT